MIFSTTRKYFLLAGILAVLAGSGFVYKNRAVNVPDTSPGEYPEVAFISDTNRSYQELAGYFKDLSVKKGATYAYNVLRYASLPPNTDLHLLGHVVGDQLYLQKGLNGIFECNQEFRNACSHAIVVGLYGDKGESALPEIAEACRRAPGGPGAYTMCFHGLGHGVLSALGYDMEGTVESCRKTGTPAYGNREFIECVGGAVMEMISGGAHEPEIWAAQRKNYLRPDEPLSICTAKYMTPDVQPWCFNYLTPYLFEAVGGDMSRPQPDDFEKAFKLCATLPVGSSRTACFGGFGKEFIVLAQDRDIRRIDQLQDEQLRKVYQWCLLAKDRTGTNECIQTAVASLFWGGENNPSAAAGFCNLVSDLAYQEACVEHILGAAVSYSVDKKKRAIICDSLGEDYKRQCKNRLLN